MQFVIVGGGAGGASCAARLRRLDNNANIIILEKTNEISIANCGLPYYCSDVISNRNAMMVSDVMTFNNLLNVDVRLNSEVINIDRKARLVELKSGDKVPYDKLVLALGAKPFIPPISGVDKKHVFTVRHLFDADNIKSYIKDNQVKSVAVIGGGFIGVEMAENMVEMGLKTSLIELAPQILPPVDADIALFPTKLMKKHGVEMFLGDSLQKINDKEVILSSGKSVSADMVIMAVGVRPETQIAKNAGIELGINGSIKVNNHMRTNDENIYACGDSVEILDFVTKSETVIPLAGPANRQGRIVADNIAGVKKSYKDTLGTSVIKVFDMTVANVGNNEKQLQKKSIPYNKVHVWGGSHAGYYPGATPILLKLIFAEDGKIFGAQAVGYDGVEKRIDVIASIMRLGGKVEDLVDAELCYAPPYSSAKDPVNIVGMAAENVIMKYIKPTYDFDLNKDILIDVRSPEMFKSDGIKGAINIPVPMLRKKFMELPKDKRIVLHCTKGFTSYVASRILLQNGFENVYSLVGGTMLYNELNS